MKRDLNRILVIIILSICSTIAVGTAAAFITGRGSFHRLRVADPSPEKVTRSTTGKPREVDAFTNIGTLRVGTKPSADNSLCAISLRPWFSYKAGDTVFYEELCQKERGLKAAILNYFAQYTKKDLLSIGDTEIKKDLRELLNQQLVLGKIINVYFDEYIFLD